MSWFDTSNFVSLAKSTLKEAQKTIDKALDISEEDGDKSKVTGDVANKVVSEPSTPLASSTIWGSFTGSFFEATTPDSSSDSVKDNVQPSNSEVDSKSSNIQSKQHQKTLHESFSLIKQRNNQQGYKNKKHLMSKSLDHRSREYQESEKSESQNKQNKNEEKTEKERKENIKNKNESDTVKVKLKTSVDEHKFEEYAQVSNKKDIQSKDFKLDFRKYIGKEGDNKNGHSNRNKETNKSSDVKYIDSNVQDSNVTKNVKEIPNELIDDIGKELTIREKNDNCNVNISTTSAKHNIPTKTVEDKYKEIEEISNNETLKTINESVNQIVPTLHKDDIIVNTINDQTPKQNIDEQYSLDQVENEKSVLSNTGLVESIDTLKHSDSKNICDEIKFEESLVINKNNIKESSDVDIIKNIIQTDENEINSDLSDSVQSIVVVTEENIDRKISDNRIGIKERSENEESIDSDSKESVIDTNKQEIILRRKRTESEREKKRNDRISSASTNSSGGGGNNRLSAISFDSNRLSSDSTSVDIITTPDSSEPSRSISTSSSVAKLRHSGSFDELTSPSVEIISESSGSGNSNGKKHDSRSSESVEVIKSGEEDVEEEEEELSMNADDSYQSMSESTQTLTTAMNIMLKSTSSLETSFSEMTSSKENISLPRSSIHPLSYSNMAQSSTLDTSSGQDLTMDGSASTLVASSDDGTFVHIPHSSSPTSLDRSEVIRVGSGHTSGDEMDTNTTSSSIEIISSPNGEGSSTTSRQSPAKLVYRAGHIYKNKIPHPISTEMLPELLIKVKTHQRVPSEASSGGSEDTELDKLQKKISEMTEILEARELKLLDLNKQYGELSDNTATLKIDNQNMLKMNEEFTQRLASLEKQYQQAIKEKDTLRRQLEAKKLAETNLQNDEDKDEIIKELREEGEKLSKQQLLLNTTIKKLRIAEKDNAKSISCLKDELQEKSEELDRCKKLLQAKEDVERTQIEAVNQLSRTNARLEREMNALQKQIDTLTSTLVESQKELRERKSAIYEMEKRLEETAASAELELRKQLELEFSLEQDRREELQNTLEHLRSNVLSMEQQHTQREEKLRRDNLELLRRLEEAQLRNEQLSESMISATKPLTQQIESLTSSHTSASAAWDLQERALNQTINDLQSRLSSIKDSEKTSRDQHMNMSSKISALEMKLEAEHKDVIRLREALASLNEDVEKLNCEKESSLKSKDEYINQLLQELKESKRQSLALEQQLSVERAAVECEKRRNVSLQEQVQNQPGQRRTSVSPPEVVSYSQRSSPALSFGRTSVTDSVFPTQSEDGDHNKSIYDSLRMGSTSLIENLQSQVKLRDGEVQHLQWELSRRDLERSTLTDQVSTLSARLEELEKTLIDHTELQSQYDALLQMYGEKLEECQELRLDLDDVKEMYKAQIDQLLKKDESG